MANKNKSMVKLLFRHLEPSFQMLESVIDYCPDILWLEINGGFPFWQQVYHALFFVDFWFRKEYSNQEFRVMVFDKKISVDLHETITQFPENLSKHELKEYAGRIKTKLLPAEAGRFGVPTISRLKIVRSRSYHSC